MADDGQAQKRKEEVHRRAGRRDEGHSLLRPAEVAGIDRNWTRPAEREIGEERRQDEHRRPERVEMHERVQGQAPLVASGRVAKSPRHPRVRELVQRQAHEHDREKQEKRLDVHLRPQ